MKKRGQNVDNKKGQVTLFIIIGLLVLSALLVFFLYVQPTYISDGAGVKGFEGCVADALEKGISELEGKAGFIEPDFTYPYLGEDIVYLCYTNDFYNTCTVQTPFLKNIFSENLETLIRNDVETCYDASLDSLRSQGYEVVSGDVGYNVEINPGEVKVNIDAPTSIGSSSFSKFNVVTNEPTYDMIMIATSILQFETSYGDADTNSLGVYYPDYYIGKIKRGDGTTIYSIENKQLGNKLQFASRSLVWPAGYNIG